MTFPFGIPLTIDAAIQDDDGVYVDPTTLVFALTDPDGDTVSYTWPTPATIERTGLGAFSREITPTISGTWTFSWTPTGDVDHVQEGAFVVEHALETVTIHLIDQADDDIENAAVGAFKDSESLQDTGTTGTGGLSVLHIQPGTYAIQATKRRVVFPTSSMITVLNTGGGTPQTFEIEGVVLLTEEPGAVARVRLYGYLAMSDGRPYDEIRIVLESVGKATFVSSTPAGSGVAPANVGITSERREVRASSSGYWEADVVAGTVCRVSIPSMKYEKQFRVPTDVAILNVADVRTDPGNWEVGYSSDFGTRDGVA